MSLSASARLLRTTAAFVLLAVQVASGEDFTVTTIAGQPGIGHRDGAKAQALFNTPYGIAAGPAGVYYVADTDNHVIRKIASDGTVTTVAGAVGVAGHVEGIGSDARFLWPQAIAVHPTNGHLFVTERSGHAIIEVDPTTGGVTVFSGLRDSWGSGGSSITDARFLAPNGMSFDASGNLYIVENCTVRKIWSTGVVSTLAGLAGSPGFVDDTGPAARFSYSTDVAVGSDGNLYVADLYNHRIRKVTLAGVVTTLAGDGIGGNLDGTGTGARVNAPERITRRGTHLCFTNADRIRQVSLTGEVTTLWTDNSTTFIALCGTADDTLLLGDGLRCHFSELASGPTLTPFAGVSDSAGSTDGDATTARFNLPVGIAAAPSGKLTIADVRGPVIRTRTTDGVVTTLAGSPGVYSTVDGTGASAGFTHLSSVVRAADGTRYVCEYSCIRRITTEGAVTTLAGDPITTGYVDATGSDARFYSPTDMAIDKDGNLYVCEYFNKTVRKITPAGVVTTVAGHPGNDGTVDATGTAASFSYLAAIAIADDGTLFVSDTYCIRRIATTGEVTTIAGTHNVYGHVDDTGTAAQFGEVTGMFVDGSGTIFALDRSHCTLRKITPPAWQVTTLAGQANVRGQADGAGEAARFMNLGRLTYWHGSLYITDSGNNTIRKATPPSGSVVVPPGGSPDGDDPGGGGGGCGVGSAATFLLLIAGILMPLRLRREID